MFELRLKMGVLLAVLFGIIYAVVVMLGTYAGINDFYLYLVFSLVLMFIQYMIGPMLIEWTMRVKYLKHQDNPKLFQMVESLAIKAGLPMPRIGIAQIAIPNAFAFGRGVKDGRICVTQGILGLLDDEELKAVLAHEMSHIKNRDVLTITILSVIPMIFYRLAWNFLFYGRRRSSDRNSGNTALIGVAAFAFYFITNLLVLYASRIREYFADRGAILLGCRPQALASALYKLVYGSARMDKEELKETEGLKAFFANDPSRAMDEIRELKALDKDRSGTIDSAELLAVRAKKIRLGVGDRMLEMLSTHPNMLKRIKQLATYQ
ncbi:MAG: zinc metalloprotease HtpX [Candidatus Omnitrophica bacterium]|nr:zinc metalloprotease HtpX [Candidatus Omnitrophota bacterium]MDD5079564.1 zinc metalloprotease HtpX [Candidatus Omnitrophota bacterium]